MSAHDDELSVGREVPASTSPAGDAVPVLFGISLIVFFLIHLVPGDPARDAARLARHRRGGGRAARAVRARPAAVAAVPVASWAGCCTATSGRSIPVRHRRDASWSATSLPADAVAAGRGAPSSRCSSASRWPCWRDQPAERLADHVVRAVPLIGLGMPAFWVGHHAGAAARAQGARVPGVRASATTSSSTCSSIVLPGADRRAGPDADPDPQPARQHDRRAGAATTW